MNEVESLRKGIAEMRSELRATLTTESLTLSISPEQRLESRLAKFRSSLLVSRIAQLRRSLSIKRESLQAIRYVVIKPSDDRFEEYLQEPDRMDRLSAMHPYRKLRGLAFSLSEHRRNACMKVIELCRFRQVSVNGVTQLIADVPQDELSSESFSFTVTSLASLALILIGKVLDIPLPFPMLYGTVVSSSCLHTELGGKSSCFPKILHAYKRTLHSAQTCSNLLSENFRQIVSQANQVPLAFSVLVQAADESVVQALYAVISAFALGREILSVNKKTSPALSASGSPAVSASYRIIEQSTAEGGEWTLLDQL